MRYRLAGLGLDDVQVAELVGLLREHVPEVSREAVKEIEQQVPEYLRNHDPRYPEVLYRMCEQANFRFLDLLEDPDASLDDMLAFFRSVGEGEAREGRGEGLWQSALRAGTGVTVRRLTEVAESRTEVPGSVIGQITQLVLAYHDQLITAMRQGHATAAARAAGEREERVRKLVDLLVTDDPDPRELAELAREARWELPRTVAAVALKRRDHGHRLPSWALPGLHLAQPCVIVSDPDGPGRRAALESGLTDWIAAIGPTTEPARTSRSLGWARRTLDLVERGLLPGDRPAVALDQVGLLVITRDDDLVGALAARLLEPLGRAREPQRERLAETLLACLECRFNANEVAVRLAVHAQTVRYRLRRLDELFGPAMHDPNRSLDLQLALRHWLAGRG
ncbi:helix-turn-helix domain-containing protein [Actinocorallia longicatena]|uniref:Helix-turn-helix domain-containing protein n=1 Tax=Actinocorallia longicatena TaxID=111803 RepID=A0ABP6QED1_9ACTN